MKDKGYVVSEHFLVSNESPYRLGENDLKV